MSRAEDKIGRMILDVMGNLVLCIASSMYQKSTLKQLCEENSMN